MKHRLRVGVPCPICSLQQKATPSDKTWFNQKLVLLLNVWPRLGLRKSESALMSYGAIAYTFPMRLKEDLFIVIFNNDVSYKPTQNLAR